MFLSNRVLGDICFVQDLSPFALGSVTWPGAAQSVAVSTRINATISSGGGGGGRCAIPEEWMCGASCPDNPLSDPICIVLSSGARTHASYSTLLRQSLNKVTEHLVDLQFFAFKVESSGCYLTGHQDSYCNSPPNWQNMSQMWQQKMGVHPRPLDTEILSANRP